VTVCDSLEKDTPDQTGHRAEAGSERNGDFHARLGGPHHRYAWRAAASKFARVDHSNAASRHRRRRRTVLNFPAQEPFRNTPICLANNQGQHFVGAARRSRCLSRRRQQGQTAF